MNGSADSRSRKLHILPEQEAVMEAVVPGSALEYDETLHIDRFGMDWKSP
jgi:hypothetical protein